MKRILCVVAFMGLFHCAFTSSRVISTLYVLHLQQPAWSVGLVLSLYAAIPALLAIHVGKWLDVAGTKIPFFLCAILMGTGCLLPIAIDASFSVYAVYLLCMFVGTGFLFAQICGQGIIGYLATNKNRATAFTYQSMVFSLSGSIGPVIAGYLIDKGSFKWGYAVSLFLIALATLLFLLFSRRLPKSFNDSKTQSTEKRKTFDLFRLPDVKNILLASSLVSMAWDLQAFMIPLYGTEIGLDAIKIGWLLSTFSVSTFAIRAVMPFLSNHFTEWKIICFVLLSAGLVFMIFPLTTNLILLFLLCIWLGSSLGASQPNVMSLLHQTSPAGRLGELIGIRTMLLNSCHSVLPLIFGFGGTVFGAAAAFWTCGSLLIGSNFYLKQNLNSIKQTNVKKKDPEA